MRIILFLSTFLGSVNLCCQDYYSDRLFVKIKDEFRNSYALERNLRDTKFFSKENVSSILPVCKHTLLSSTYEIVFEKEIVLDSLISQLSQLEQIEYAEKVPIYQLFFTPNDPLYSSQWNLAKIQADLAWNLGQGCTNVKIAVTDDGFLLNHEDLVNQWHINSGEINGNGIDDDGNGYIDDWRGWDAANNDNDPSATAPTNSFFTHGTHVAGIVAAQTHNSLGIASIGYNCKIIPVKIGSSPSSSLTGAFQGLDYAINASGCDVINMSWGGGGWSATYQALFNIAKTKGILCVAAAGNSNTSTPMYPASYNHVISVAASSSTDARASFSNYGSSIDVTAPGVNIQSCLAGATNAYGNMSGTSMASPLVAGLCGLMKCYNPMPSDSIEACLKRTSDNINAQNPSFIGQLGAGRINAFQALQCLTKKPKSDFLALDTFQCVGKSVRYVAKSFGIPTLTYSWSFPGGTPSNSSSTNPMVTYSTHGLKSSTLITCNSLGCDTITKTNYVTIDTPKAWLTNRKYTSYNSNPVIITVHFKGNPPYNVTLTDGTNNFTQTNIRSNPYFFSIVPKKDTSLISISSFSDSLCVGNRFGLDTIHRIILFGGGGTQYCESSFKFTNNNGYVSITKQNSASLNQLYDYINGFTWETWVRLEANSSSYRIIMSTADDASYEDIFIAQNWIGTTNKLTFEVRPKNSVASSGANVSTTASLSLNKWYHVAAVCDYIGGNIKIYLNGVLEGTSTISYTQSQRLSREIETQIANFPPSYNNVAFAGQADEIRFWKGPRSQSQIQANYKLCLLSDTTNLIAYFKADEGTGINTTSRVNGNFIGTLKNSVSWDSQTDSVKNCTICQNSLCRDSMEINSAQTGWQALQTNGTWGSLTSCNYVTSLFTANAANFPGMTVGNCLWGPIVSSPSRTYYNSSSQTTTSTSNADMAVFRKELAIPADSEIDSVRLWMLSDDFVDSVFINSKNIYTTPSPITYGQVLFTKKEANIGTAVATNFVTIKAGDLGGNYGHYFRMKVYYRKVCTSSIPKCIDSNIIFTDTSWQYQNTSGTWVPATLGINTCGQYAHATWSPSVLIGLTNQNQMIWGGIGSSPSTVRKQITIPDKSLIDSIRIKIQADDNVFAMKINGTTITSTPFGWNNVSNIVINNASLVNGVNNFTLEGVNSSACAWLAMKMIIYSRKDCGSDCDTTNLNTGKVLHLDFNGNTQDKSGNGNHATNYGATPVSGKAGFANTAYRFDSTNYMSVAHHSSLNLRNFSITALLKPLKFNTNLCYGNNIISKGANGAPGQWALVYGPADAGTTCVGRDTNLNNFLLCGSTCQTSWYIPDTPYMKHDKWNCLVTTYDSTSKVAKIYVDGKLRHQWTTTWDLLTSSNTLDVLIGKYSGINYPYYIQATIDDIRIYNRVLAPSEVKGYCGTCNVTPPPISANCLKVKSVQQISENIGGFTQSLQSNGWFGCGVSNVGDWDGDGMHELWVGAGATNNTGGAYANGRNYFLRMNSNGTVKSSTVIDASTSPFTGSNTHYSSFMGVDAQVIGDINGDGIKDIIVGGHKDPTGANEAGAAFVLFMNASGNVNSVVKWANGLNGVPSSTFGFRSDFGNKITAIGDWDGDGIPDAAIGAIQHSEYKTNGGSFYIVLINSNGTIKQFIKVSGSNNSVISSKIQDYSLFGSVEFLGDINGDGLKEFAVGASATYNTTNLGKIYILSINPNGTINSILSEISQSLGGFTGSLAVNDAFGFKISNIGDIDRDGVVDIMIGAFQDDDGGSDKGAAWILFLNSNGSVKKHIKISNNSGIFPTTLSNGSLTGYSVDQVGDLDGNGITDLAIGSPIQQVNGSPKGSVWILFMEDTCAMVPPCDTSGLVLCMSMDGTSNDSSKYNNHGTKIGGVSNTNDRNGKSNSAFSFNGTNAYIEVPSASSIQLTNELTISLWINQTSTSTQGYRLVDKITATTGDGYLFDTYGHPTNATWRGRTTRFVSKEVNWHSNNKPYNLNSWVHVAVTHKNGLVSYYTNGVLDTSYSHSVTALNINTLPLRIGAGNPLNFYFNGAMDDLKIYRRALTATEVSNLYTKPFTCNCSSIQPPPCDTAQRYTYTQCFNDSIQVMARAGSKYQWSPVSGLSNDIIRNPKVFVSSNQRYLVSYTSSKNCQLIDTIDVEVKAAAVYPKMDDQLICTGDSVQMTIPIYATNIVWSPNTAISSTNSKNPFFFPTTPTTYYLEFRDTFGCLHRDTFVVHTKVCCPARARFSIPKDLLCFGESLSITNTSKGPITSYNWNFSTAIPNTFANANPPSISFPSGGSYSLRLIVTNGSCLDTMIKTVNVVHIIPNAGKDTTNCLGAFTTQLGESAISDWSYNWTPTKYLSDPKISDPICSIVNDSVHYVLEIIDRNSGCKAYDTVVVYTNRSIDSTVQNLRICGGDSVLFDGIQRKTSGNYYYTLKKVDGICDSLINVLRLNVLMKQINPPITLLMCDEYIDAKGKKHTESLIEYDTIKSKSILNCDSILNVRKIIIYKRVYRDRPAVSGCAPFRYNGKTYLTSKMKADSIRIRNINLYNCDTIEYINIIVHPRPKALIIPSIPNPVMYKQTVTLTASGGQTYLWLQIGSTNQEIEYKINNTQPKLYTVRVTDENDCWDTVSYTIKGELPDTCFYGFPNVFSPNQDNLNDEYIPNMDECTEIKVFAIYDRWGEKVFETNQQKGWNGFFKGKPAPMAVYLYYAEMITPWGIRTHKGSFTLVR